MCLKLILWLFRLLFLQRNACCQSNSPHGQTRLQLIFCPLQTKKLLNEKLNFWVKSLLCNKTAGIPFSVGATTTGLIANSILLCCLFAIKDKWFHKCTINGFVSCFWQSSATSASSRSRPMVSLFIWNFYKAMLRDLEVHSVSSKSPSRFRDGVKGFFLGGT